MTNPTAGSGATLLRDLIDIPEKVDASDYVLRLHEGVEAADRTLRDYVVTDSIRASLDEALGLVERTLTDRTAKGAFIHGSFGSGKSHFMAVMHLLLSGNAAARGLRNLQDVVDKRRTVLGKKLLAIDYHLIGAESFESALFTGYLATVERKHPDVPLPMLHKSEGLFDDAQRMRAKMGDESFFASLSAGADDGWGELAADWNAETFDAAIAKPVGDPDRERLAQTLVAELFTGYARVGEWVDISEGLRAMTQHAKGLGYDGLVLFLDELVLWLGAHLSDTTFIQSETQKVAKLVETGIGLLPLPIISFVARQRALKDFLGGGEVRAQQEALAQSFQWWEDRFEKITLSAGDLPTIVKQRLLSPRDEAAQATLDAALARVKSDHSAWSYLMTDEVGANESDFSKIYPFSPALVDAMVALSSLMQRDRTALKLMGELLAEGRDALTVNDVIPVGDLFDPVVTGSSEPLTDDMKKHFAITREFYLQRFRPYLLQKHQLTDAAAQALPREHAFRTEDRLAKTLLISHLVPQTLTLQSLTAGRLAALNWGTVNAWVPGTESAQVLEWVKQWASMFGEFTIGEGADPIIAVHLTGVDYTSVLARVSGEDNDSNRRQVLRGLIESELGIAPPDGIVREQSFSVVWRGSKRTLSVYFGNIRDKSDVTDEILLNPTSSWRLVIDYPFDPAVQSPSPKDDLNRLNELKAEGNEALTLAWVPNFLNATRLDEVGTLAMLDHVLKPAQFDQNSIHLPVSDREPARRALENKREQMTLRLREVLRQAYGVNTAVEQNVDVVIEGNQIVTSLLPGLVIQPPVATNLRDGLIKALDQAWQFHTPKHPPIEEAAEVRAAQVREVIALVQSTHENGGRTQGLQTGQRNLLKQIAVPLGLGQLNENVYAISAANLRWRDEFTRWAAESPQGITVASIRVKLAEYGMSEPLEDAVILTWAIINEQEWVRGGAPIPAPAPGSLAGDITLRAAHLPSEAEWELARSRAQQVFGIQPDHALVSGAVRRLGVALLDEATKHTERARDLVTLLTEHASALGIDAKNAGARLETAERARDLLVALGAEKDAIVRVELLAAFDLPAEARHIARSISSATEVVQALRGADWEAMRAAAGLGRAEVDAALAKAREAASHDEFVTGLSQPLGEASRVSRLAVLPPGPGPSPDPVPVPVPVDPDDVVLSFEGTELDREMTAMQKSISEALNLESNKGKKVRITWRLE